MTKLADLKTHLHDFEIKARTPIKANKGGDTWVKVQQIADKVPAAVNSSIHSIEQFRDSKDPSDKTKIPGHIKTMRNQLNAIDLAAVTKYIAEHREGGAKARGLLSTAATKAEEKKRVAAAGELVRLVGLMQIELNSMTATDV
jgi:hypothetical protein